MSDFSIEDLEPSEPQMLWVRVQLDFGPTGIELEDVETHATPDEDPDSPEARLRRELEQMVGAIQQARGATNNALGEQDLAELENLLKEPGALEDMFEKVLTEHRENEGETPSESDTAPAQIQDNEQPNATADDLDFFELEKAEQEAEERQRLDAEIEQRIVETTADDVINALMLASIDSTEVMVHETTQESVILYVLCESDGQSLTTVHMQEDGSVEPGQPFDVFVDDLLEQLPVRGAICADQFSYSFSAPVTALGEELALSNDGTVAALVELPMTEIPTYIGQTPLAGPIEAAPADNGWSLITGDPVSLLNLLSLMRVPSIVAETSEGLQHLAFVFPGSSQLLEEGSVGEWMTKVVGSPDDSDVGSILEFAWGAPKILTRYIPRNSAVLDYLWLLPGVLPEPLHEIRAAEEIDNLAWLYGLDEQTSKRLANYVNDMTSEIGLESVIQVLQLPEELSNVAASEGSMQDYVGYREFTPEMTGMDLLKQTVTAYPNGSGPLNAVARELMARPWLVAADGAAALGAAGAFALWAARRAARGDNPKAALIAAAALGASGSAELVMASIYSKLKNVNFVQDTAPQAPSLMEELKAQVEGTDTAKISPPEPKVLRKAKQVGQRVSDATRQGLKKFFGKE